MAPYIETVPPTLIDQLAQYLDLLLHWNARTNLTAIRSPEEIVQRHFGESLFAARYLTPTGSLLDFGSGAGFPGLPIALYHPHLSVTLAESQHKKASFLREVIRHLHLSVGVWPQRVEEMPATQQFDSVTLRAVDRMNLALPAASLRATRQIMLLAGRDQQEPDTIPDFEADETHLIPNSTDRFIFRFSRR